MASTNNVPPKGKHETREQEIQERRQTWKPCPFPHEGTELNLIDMGPGKWWIACPCGAMGPISTSPDEAAERWNKRTSDAAQATNAQRDARELALVAAVTDPAYGFNGVQHEKRSYAEFLAMFDKAYNAALATDDAAIQAAVDQER